MLQNDVAGIILKLGKGWQEDDLKELADIIKGMCQDFTRANLPMTSELVKKQLPNVLELPKKPSLIVVDAQGVVKEKPLVTEAATECSKCGSILMENETTCPECS